MKIAPKGVNGKTKTLKKISLKEVKNNLKKVVDNKN